MSFPIEILLPKNETLPEGMSLLNTIPNKHFECVARKVVNQEEFSEQDVESISADAKLNVEQLRCAVKTISFTLKQLARFFMKPTDLRRALVENSSIEDDKAQLLVKCWSENVGKQYEIENKEKLVSISWDLNVQVGSSASLKESVPVARIQLETENKNSILITLNEEELLHLYHTVENVQMKLDIT